MIKLIDTLSYQNSLRALSPLWKCGFAVAMLLLSYLSHPVTQVLIACWMAIWTIVYAQIPTKYYFLVVGLACLFFVGSLPALIIDVRPLHETLGAHDQFIAISIFQWRVWITTSGLGLAALLFARVIASLSCMMFIMFSTPFSELLQVMKKVRVPSLVLEIMLIMYRFLFILFEIAHDMFIAQQSRGGQTGFSNRLKDTAMLIVQLFMKTMQRYRTISNGLVSRGFTDDIHFAPYEARPVPFRYKLESSCGFLLLLFLEIWLRWRIIR
ncbi:cobalt ECF transporter T component CbiQ [Paenibacillus sp. N3.4]|uniref:cobalt ECF transporter T component CbiQ n=1 Tax=Paenibacillus sp. N3.4 TaxID=2603222 RepID=UPI0011CC2478|nr:cobalt ECF transporter T component CbiQ [Paenibacillus sp. N3.4]TXK84691.1 cobalt ECF transporter T component CbiQ [Paenibacillus sp. N3.4]